MTVVTAMTDGAITHSVIKVTLRARMCTHSYILFFNGLVWSVLGGPNWATLHENMPLGPNFDDKKIYMALKNEGGPVKCTLPSAYAPCLHGLLQGSLTLKFNFFN